MLPKRPFAEIDSTLPEAKKAKTDIAAWEKSLWEKAIASSHQVTSAGNDIQLKLFMLQELLDTYINAIQNLFDLDKNMTIPPIFINHIILIIQNDLNSIPTVGSFNLLMFVKNNINLFNDLKTTISFDRLMSPSEEMLYDVLSEQIKILSADIADQEEQTRPKSPAFVTTELPEPSIPNMDAGQIVSTPKVDQLMQDSQPIANVAAVVETPPALFQPKITTRTATIFEKQIAKVQQVVREEIKLKPLLQQAPRKKTSEVEKLMDSATLMDAPRVRSTSTSEKPAKMLVGSEDADDPTVKGYDKFNFDKYAVQRKEGELPEKYAPINFLTSLSECSRKPKKSQPQVSSARLTEITDPTATPSEESCWSIIQRRQQLICYQSALQRVLSISDLDDASKASIQKLTFTEFKQGKLNFKQWIFNLPSKYENKFNSILKLIEKENYAEAIAILKRKLLKVIYSPHSLEEEPLKITLFLLLSALDKLCSQMRKLLEETLRKSKNRSKVGDLQQAQLEGDITCVRITLRTVHTRFQQPTYKEVTYANSFFGNRNTKSSRCRPVQALSDGKMHPDNQPAPNKDYANIHHYVGTALLLAKLDQRIIHYIDGIQELNVALNNLVLEKQELEKKGTRKTVN